MSVSPVRLNHAVRFVADVDRSGVCTAGGIVPGSGEAGS
jgi:hypothetical protein